MNDQNTVEQARLVVSNILSALEISRVVYVDDAHRVQLEDVIAAVVNLDEDKLLNAFPEFGNSKPEDADVVSSKVRSTWGQLDSQKQVQRGQAVLVAAKQQDGEDANDILYASIVGELVLSVQLLNLTPEQWEVQKGNLLQESQSQRTLFLFDRAFNGTDPDGGIKIIASLLNGSSTQGLICGLLTHTVTPETQLEQWIELSRTYQIPKDQLVVIPKLHLSDNPIVFARMLKFVALSPDFDKLKQKTKEIIETAAVEAAKHVDDVGIHDLDFIVFQVSNDEGIWEPDMLFRLHALYHRIEARKLAHEGGILEQLAANLRRVSEIPIIDEQTIPLASTWALQRDELYEFSDYINQNYLPLELGDIFEKIGSDSTKKYILLAQPCDLMVRSKGRRSPELERVPLAEIVLTDEQPKYSEEIPYFDELPNKKWFVLFKRIHFVRLCVLDLCVFNNDGVAKINNTNNIHPNVRPSWKKRYSILSRTYSQIFRKAERVTPSDSEHQISKQVKQQIAKEFNELLLNDDLFKGNFVENNGNREVVYNCKRIGRLTRARALGLLMSYTSTLGRPAYDREFRKEDQ